MILVYGHRDDPPIARLMDALQTACGHYQLPDIAALALATRPLTVAAQCVAMSQAMGLPLSGITLRLWPDGKYVYCEVNPMPAFSDFNAKSGLPIAAAPAELLMDSV
ncbi:MAG: hypothetical protein H7172_11775 [Ferruginibacter sp.]|nr:hypothetical protein [Rhodoferax sp.]